MSKIDDLIQLYCPDGVEYKAIKDCFFRLKGTPITAKKMKEIADESGRIRIYAGGKTMVNAHESNISNANIIDKPSVLIQSRGVIDAIYCDFPYTFKNEMWAYTSDNATFVKFLYYVIKNNINSFREKASGMGSLPQISLKVTDSYQIPIPPMEVQQEIVRVLDSFTELEAELEAELSLRQKQYEHYRDQLLTFDEDDPDVEWKTLGEVSINHDKKRKPIKKELRCAGKYPYYGASGIVDYINDYIFEGEYLLVSEDGANLFARTYPIAFEISGKNWVNNHAHVLEIEDKNLRKMLCIYLNSIDLEQYISKGAQPKLNKQKLNNIKVPVPNSNRLAYIVDILDKFDALVNDISQGIPAEIKARRKQYEYYRDKLLSFKDINA